MIQRLRIFSHHIYELQKGLRHLILFTAARDDLRAIFRKLRAKRIAYMVLPVAEGSDRVNVFFGNASCVEVIRKFQRKRLADFSPEQDFILGIMLGYDRVMQCERYLRRRGRRPALAKNGARQPRPEPVGAATVAPDDPDGGDNER